MSKTKNRGGLAPNIIRNGEGTLLSAKPTSIVGVDGQTAVILNVDLLEAPVPDRRYAADFASLVYKNDVVKLIFGQEKLGSPGIRSLVVIAVHAPEARNILQSLQSFSTTTLDEIVTKYGIKAIDLYTISEEPEQTIALAASFVAAAVAKHAACLDFYSASAFAIANLNKTQKLAVDPVVRIDLPTSYLVALRNELVKLEVSFPPDSTGEKL